MPMLMEKVSDDKCVDDDEKLDLHDYVIGVESVNEQEHLCERHYTCHIMPAALHRCLHSLYDGRIGFRFIIPTTVMLTAGK